MVVAAHNRAGTATAARVAASFLRFEVNPRNQAIARCRRAHIKQESKYGLDRGIDTLHTNVRVHLLALNSLDLHQKQGEEHVKQIKTQRAENKKHVVPKHNKKESAGWGSSASRVGAGTQSPIMRY